MIECPGCSSTSPLTELESLTVKGMLYRLYECGACSLHFWAPRVMPDPSFYESEQEEDSKARLFRHDLIEYELRPYHKQFFVRPPPIGRLLDIGCGDGKFIEVAEGKGYEVWGLDLDSKAIEVASQRGLEKVFPSTLDQFIGKNPEPFDVITFFEVLEHQADPAGFVACLKEILNRNGTLYGSVPNRDRFLMAPDARWDSPPHHFTRWTDVSLRTFLTLNGFSEIDILNVHFGYRTMAYYGTFAGYFKRKSLGGLSERELLLYSVEKLQKEHLVAGVMPALLQHAKKAVKFAITPFILAESAIERLTRRGQTLVFKCRLD
ncbi:MAG: class I SAM-dependent methyltransferase [Geobacteraceae bacterium]